VQEDWDDEDDGEWEAPQIDNPEYKGKWTQVRAAFFSFAAALWPSLTEFRRMQKRIPNPAYKGAWVHPEIDNPDFVDDKARARAIACVRLPLAALVLEYLCVTPVPLTQYYIDSMFGCL
jgi:hypothetical protein